MLLIGWLGKAAATNASELNGPYTGQKLKRGELRSRCEAAVYLLWEFSIAVVKV